MSLQIKKFNVFIRSLAFMALIYSCDKPVEDKLYKETSDSQLSNNTNTTASTFSDEEIANLKIVAKKNPQASSLSDELIKKIENSNSLQSLLTLDENQIEKIKLILELDSYELSDLFAVINDIIYYLKKNDTDNISDANKHINPVFSTFLYKITNLKKIIAVRDICNNIKETIDSAPDKNESLQKNCGLIALMMTDQNKIFGSITTSSNMQELQEKLKTNGKISDLDNCWFIYDSNLVIATLDQTQKKLILNGISDVTTDYDKNTFSEQYTMTLAQVAEFSI